MRNEYAVYMGSERVGTAQVIIEGLFYKIYCLCQLDGTVPCKITVCGENEVDLGICVPLQNGFGMKTRIPIKKIGKGELRFCVLPKYVRRDEHFLELSTEKPFRYIHLLKDAYMSHKDGHIGIGIINQSLSQQGSDQNP